MFQKTFEKKGIEFKVADAPHGRFRITALGGAAFCEPLKHPKAGWCWRITGSEFTKKITGNKKDLYIVHPSAEEARNWKKDKEQREREDALEALRSGKSPIQVKFWDGEILSGYMAFGLAAELLQKLGLAREIQGWGTKVNDDLVNALGTEFTYQQAVEFAQPMLEEKARKRAEKKAERQAKFAEARRTGKPVELRRWSEPCPDPNESCDIDNVFEYAMPDGTIKVERHHTW